MGDGKISVPSVGGIWYQSPDVEVVLRFQEPGWGRGGGLGDISCPICCRIRDSGSFYREENRVIPKPIFKRWDWLEIF